MSVLTAADLTARASYPQFAQKFSAESGALAKTQVALTAAMDGQTGEVKQALDALRADAFKAGEALEKVASHTPKGFVPDQGVDAKAFEEAHGAVKKAHETLHNFLSGKTMHKVGEVEVNAPEALSAVHGKFTEAVEGAAKIMNSVTGNVRVNGWMGALKDNFNFTKGAITKDRGLAMAGRGVGVTVGATMFGDALLRSKSDGEARSTFGRILEGTTGVALAAGSALTGAAR